MIDILYDREHCSLTVSGHAGYADAGHDIVCAGVSALFNTLALLDHSYIQTGMDNNIHMVFSNRPKKERIIYNAAAAGLKRMAESYGKWMQYRDAAPH